MIEVAEVWIAYWEQGQYSDYRFGIIDGWFASEAAARAACEAHERETAVMWWRGGEFDYDGKATPPPDVLERYRGADRFPAAPTYGSHRLERADVPIIRSMRMRQGGRDVPTEWSTMGREE